MFGCTRGLRNQSASMHALSVSLRVFCVYCQIKTPPSLNNKGALNSTSTSSYARKRRLHRPLPGLDVCAGQVASFCQTPTLLVPLMSAEAEIQIHPALPLAVAHNAHLTEHLGHLVHLPLELLLKPTDTNVPPSTHSSMPNLASYVAHKSGCPFNSLRKS